MDLLQTRLKYYDELIAAARGKTPVDLLIEGGRLLNVLTGEILTGNIAVHKGFIVALFSKNIEAKQRINARGTIAIPAFIDPHVHIESSMVLPPAYAEVVAANGVGTVYADPHEIVNVMGLDGFKMMVDNAVDLPVRIFFDIPTCVPSKREAEYSGADVQAAEVEAMAQLGGRKLGELMSYDEIVGGEPVMTGIVQAGWRLGMPRDAHFPLIGVLANLFNSLNPLQKIGVAAGMLAPPLNGLASNIFTSELRKQSFPELNAYMVALGLTADHETYGPEIQTKLDHGMRLMISAHIFLTFPQLNPVFLQAVKRLRYKDGLGLCTDDIWADDLFTKGGVVWVLRQLVKKGIDPVDAVRFATLNNAQRLAQAGNPEAALIGMLAPGMAADIVLVGEPLSEFNIKMVIHDGQVVAENGKLTRPVPQPRVPSAALDSVQVTPVTAETFRIAAPGGARKGKVKTRVLAMPKPPALPFADLTEETISIKDGFLETRGYMLIAAFNRYGKGEPGPVIGLVKGYSMKEGAVASTMSHDSHNLVVLGMNAADMALAVNTVLEMKGGFAVVRNGKILATVAFPVGGIMSTESVEVMAGQSKAFREAIASLGLDPKGPILHFAVLFLPAGPGAKVTDRGIWDATQQSLVPLFVSA